MAPRRGKPIAMRRFLDHPSRPPRLERLRHVARGVATVLLLPALLTGCEAGERTRALDLPPRPADAEGGSEIARQLGALSLEQREARILDEITGGNVPSWLRTLRPVTRVDTIAGRRHHVTFWVTPDYLAVGSDEDAMLMPMTAETGQRIADRVGASLPTPVMVDAIWDAADVQLVPIRLARDDSTRTVSYFVRHDRLIAAQRRVRKVPADAFVAGHKVDLVISALQSASPDSVALYGWHFPSGQRLQDLTTAVPDTPVSYSHGVRLVHRTVQIDGDRRDLLDVLRDPELAPLLSRDGPIAAPRYPRPGTTHGATGRGDPDSDAARTDAER